MIYLGQDTICWAIWLSKLTAAVWLIYHEARHAQNVRASHRSALGEIDFQFQPDSTQTARRPFSCLYPGGESEPVNGDLAPSQHINHTLFKSPHPHPSGTRTKATLEGNENRSGAARTRMGWCREPRLIIRVSLDKKWTCLQKCVYLHTSVDTTPRAKSRTRCHRSHLLYQNNTSGSLRAGYNYVQAPIRSEGPGRGVTRTVLCTLIIRIVLANSWRAPWRDKRLSLPARSLWCHAD